MSRFLYSYKTKVFYFFRINIDAKSQVPSLPIPKQQPTCITSVASTIQSTIQETAFATSVVKTSISNIHPPRIQNTPLPTPYHLPPSVVTQTIRPETKINIPTSTIMPIVTNTQNAMPVQSMQNIMTANQIGYLGKSSNIHVPISHIVNSTPMVMSKPPMVSGKANVIQTGVMQQQQQQMMILKTGLGGVKVAQGPLSPRLQQSLASKGLPQGQMKPTPMQPQLGHLSHKLLRPGCVGAGPLGPSLPRGAQGQHASPPLHKHHIAPQPVIAGWHRYIPNLKTYLFNTFCMAFSKVHCTLCVLMYLVLLQEPTVLEWVLQLYLQSALRDR